MNLTKTRKQIDNYILLIGMEMCVFCEPRIPSRDFGAPIAFITSSASFQACSSPANMSASCFVRNKSKKQTNKKHLVKKERETNSPITSIK